MDNKSFGDLVTFTRASTGWYLNAAGLLVSAGNNEPRFEYDALGNPLGLLFEQQRTNLALQSGDFSNAAWVKSAVTLGATTLGPDGVTLVPKLVENTANSTHALIQTGKVIAGNTKYCRSVFAKSDGSGRLLYLESDSFAQWSNAGAARFNLDTGAITQVSPVLDSVGMRPLPNGWYLCWLVTTSVASPVAVPFDVQIADGSGNPSYLGDGVSGLYAWGAQLEAGDCPSSYIPTVASTVTRAADLAFVPATDWLQAGEGTLFADVAHDTIPTPTVGEVGSAILSRNTTVGRIALWVSSNSRANGHVVDDANVTQFNVAMLPNLVSGQVMKQAIAYKTDDFQFSTAGALSAVDTSGVLPLIDRIVLGARGAANNHMQGHIRRIRYYPRRLSAADLQALTL